MSEQISNQQGSEDTKTKNSEAICNLRDNFCASMEGNGSCLPKEPFMTLGSGQAPKLNYQMPQKSGFTAYGHFVPPLDDNVFLEQAKEPPIGNFYDQVRQFNELKSGQQEIIEKQLQEELLSGQGNTQLIPGFVAKVGRRHVEISEQPMDGVEQETSLKQSAPTSTGGEIIVCGVGLNELTDKISEGQQPSFSEGLGGYTSTTTYQQEPITPNPTLFVIEEYTIASYLGDYGAGKTLKTMSLLPGEKTTITIKTFRESTTNQSRAENILESFTEDSVQEIERSIEDESSINQSSSTSVSHSANVQAKASAKIVGVNAEVSAGYEFSLNNNSNRTSNVRSLGRALDKHVQNSNNHREVDVNTTTETTVTEGQEKTLTRELQNYNKSRVLNFVFRQLLQEYVTLTYLSDIRIGYTNGYFESLRVVDIEELDTLLDAVVQPQEKENVRAELLKYYCKVKNYNGFYKDFIETKEIDYGDCVGVPGIEKFWGKIAGNLDSYSLGDGLEINVPGVILNVQKHILRTDSVVADALLGQGEALDCFNMRTQDATAMQAYLANAELLQKMEIVDQQATPADKAAIYKKVFGDCCDTIQTQDPS